MLQLIRLIVVLSSKVIAIKRFFCPKLMGYASKNFAFMREIVTFNSRITQLLLTLVLATA